MPDLTVTYEAGVLKPTIPLTLREGQTLQIRILETDIPEQSVNQAALDLLRSWREDGDEQEQKETCILAASIAVKRVCGYLKPDMA
jgi:predicted DNA-binding antitoxin AbrB/MazE fold protein